MSDEFDDDLPLTPEDNAYLKSTREDSGGSSDGGDGNGRCSIFMIGFVVLGGSLAATLVSALWRVLT